MIDCHNHILPGLDDGAHDDAMSVAMGKTAIESGIDTIVCTPHHLNGVFTNPRAQVLQAIQRLRQLFEREGIALTLVPGSELHLVPEVPGQVVAKRALTYGDHGRAALVELPKQTVPTGTIERLRELIRAGVTPVIAHPERNGVLARSPRTLLEWVNAGCKVQLTGQSVSGEFGADIQRVCDYWIQHQCAHLVASDAHRPRGRKPDLTAAMRYVCDNFGEHVAVDLFLDNPQRLIQGEDLEMVAKPKMSVRGLMTRARGKTGLL